MSPAHTDTLAPAAQELLAVLLAELPMIEQAFDDLVATGGQPEPDELAWGEALRTAAELLGRMGSAAASIGLEGFAQVCAHAESNLGPLQPGGDSALDMWPLLAGAIRNYLSGPLESESAAALAELLADPQWPLPLSREDADPLTRRLASPDFSTLEEAVPGRKEVAQPEDVSLAVPEEADPGVLDGLLIELPQYCDEFSSAMDRMADGSGTLDDLNLAQRAAHTLKGAANTVGIRGIAELTHHLEDILSVLSKVQALPTTSLGQVLLQASDCLGAMADSFQGLDEPPEDAVNVLQQVLDWAHRIDAEGPPKEEPAVPEPVTEPATQPQSSHREATSQTQEGKMLRVPSGLVDELLRLVGENVIHNVQLRERLRAAREANREVISHLESLRQRGAELEAYIDVKNLSLPTAPAGAISAFDDLELDQYNEIHSFSRSMIEAAVDAREIGRELNDDLVELNELLVSQEQLNRDTQEGVLTTRMVAAQSVKQRLQRVVRRVCRDTGKQAELVFAGGDTLIDSDLLAQFVDSLIHLLRNAVDHGIESEEVRREAGKPVTGSIELDFSRDGGYILLRCIDDGGGLDWDRVRQVGIETGLINPDSEPSRDELTRVLLQPNVTTRRQATQTSGRGIGLDAVYAQATGLGGSMTLDSTPGQGCVVELRMPVSLMSSHALIIKEGSRTVAIASRGVQQLMHVNEGAIRTVDNERVFQLGDRVYPLRSMRNLLGLGGEPEAPSAVLLLDAGATSQAVLVDRVAASEDLVVKSLGGYIPKLAGIIGATILGDGTVVPVVDLPKILRAPRATDAAIHEGASEEESVAANVPVALVVDDSLTARRALKELLSDEGFKVHTASDGMDAVSVLNEATPDIVFVDLEMPRMNGIELASHIRFRHDTREVPVVVITSRSTAKHRQQAEAAGINAYLTKPFSDDKVLAVIDSLLRDPAAAVCTGGTPESDK